jgi:NAD(P)-dependent dehydrogenase (short-subunit alcohol dehydrogenase family)
VQAEESGERLLLPLREPCSRISDSARAGGGPSSNHDLFPRSKRKHFAHDLFNVDDVPNLIGEIHRWIGDGIDILVSNAGIARFDVADYQKNMQFWQETIATKPPGSSCSYPSSASGDVVAPVWNNHKHREPKSRVNVDYMGAYSASKTALLRFHHNLEYQIRGHGFYSYYLQPGNVDTSILDGVVDRVNNTAYLNLCDGAQRMRQRVLEFPKKRSPESVAGACVWLATDENAKLLSGRYVDTESDVQQVLEDLRNGMES